MWASQKDAQLIQLQEENRKLRRAVDELVILNELALDIGAKLDLQEILRLVVKRSIKAVHAEQGTITLVKRQQQDLQQTLVRTQQSTDHGQPFHLNQALLGWMQLNKRPLVVRDPHHDSRFHGIVWDQNIHSLMCVPLLIKSTLIGILAVINKKDGEFSDEDTRLLTIVASQSAQIIENVRLYEEEKDLLQIKEQLRLASQIQSSLLPKQAPSIPGYDIAGYSKPAQVVGGDYFDFICVGPGRLALCVGDISGKGLPAAMLMANLQATIRGQCAVDPSPGVCLGRANALLHQSTDPQKYATLFYCILDFQNHQLTYSNAGHNWPYLIRRNGANSLLKAGGVALSFLPNAEYEQESVVLSPGDLCVLYSDGLTEAMNANDEEYGEKRLLACIQQNGELAAGQLINKLIESAENHAKNCPQWDDMTLVVIKRIGINDTD
ncbi:MAG TPA: PP2C family protein-serine/threonine phosphatase [bacterium]|nr:PP2C family protein-serine/threonine phosphatase [bacterium]